MGTLATPEQSGDLPRPEEGLRKPSELQNTVLGIKTLDSGVFQRLLLLMMAIVQLLDYLYVVSTFKTIVLTPN